MHILQTARQAKGGLDHLTAPRGMRMRPRRSLTRVQTFDDGGGVDEVTPAQNAHEVRVELGNLDPRRPMHDEPKELMARRRHRGGKKTFRAAFARSRPLASLP